MVTFVIATNVTRVEK